MCRVRGRHSQNSWQVHYFVQISWQAQHFVNLHASPNIDGEAPRNDGARRFGSWSDHGRMARNRSSIVIRGFSCFLQISWQAQHFVKLHVQISWQAQHFVKLHVQVAAQYNRTGGFEPGKSSSAEGHSRVTVGSWSGHAQIVPPWLEFHLS